MNKLRYAIIILLFFVSCKKEKIINNSVIGEWQWVKTSGGFVGVTITPQNSGKNWTIAFKNNSIYTAYGTLTGNDTGNYSLIISDSMQTLIFSNGSYLNGAYYYYNSNDSLLISQSYLDGFDYLFMRKK